MKILILFFHDVIASKRHVSRYEPDALLVAKHRYSNIVSTIPSHKSVKLGVGILDIRFFLIRVIPHGLPVIENVNSEFILRGIFLGN